MLRKILVGLILIFFGNISVFSLILYNSSDIVPGEFGADDLDGDLCNVNDPSCVIISQH